MALHTTAPVLFCKACEIFISEITARAFIIADSNKRRTLSRADIAKALSKSDQFDFLIDIVPRDDLPCAGRGGTHGTVSGIGRGREVGVGIAESTGAGGGPSSGLTVPDALQMPMQPQLRAHPHAHQDHLPTSGPMTPVEGTGTKMNISIILPGSVSVTHEVRAAIEPSVGLGKKIEENMEQIDEQAPFACQVQAPPQPGHSMTTS